MGDMAAVSGFGISQILIKTKMNTKQLTRRQNQKLTGSNYNKVSPQTPNTSSENDHQKSPDLLVTGVYGAEETT